MYTPWTLVKICQHIMLLIDHTTIKQLQQLVCRSYTEYLPTFTTRSEMISNWSWGFNSNVNLWSAAMIRTKCLVNAASVKLPLGEHLLQISIYFTTFCSKIQEVKKYINVKTIPSVSPWKNRGWSGGGMTWCSYKNIIFAQSRKI